MKDVDLDLPRMAPSRASWLETTLITSVALAALVWVDPSPYLALAPLLAGARYGTLHGLVSGLCLTLAFTTAFGVAAFPVDTGAGIASLAWLVAGAIPGAFRDAWERRARSLETASHIQRMRLESLGRAYHVLHASHDRLQRLLPGQPSSLREALQSLRESLVDVPCETPDAFARRVLDFLRDHVGVRAATWHPVDDARRATFAIASLGTEERVTQDLLIEQAAAHGEVTSVRDLSVFNRGSTLVAVPLIDVEGRVHAVVAVRELPFVSLHEDTLSLLAVLGGHIGDLISLRRTLSVEEAALPQSQFRTAVNRAMADARAHRVPSSLLVMSFRPQPPAALHTGEALHRIARRIAVARRATDSSDILIDSQGHIRVHLLLRLADEQGLAQCAARLEKLALDELENAGLACHIDLVGWPLDQAALQECPMELRAFLHPLHRDGRKLVLVRRNGQAV
jgi:polysaccharide biosynthesis protein PelD